MPTAPTLNRPPRAPTARSNQGVGGLKFGGSFARPPTPRQTPTGGRNDVLRGAAINTATRGNPLARPPGPGTVQSGPLRTGPTPGPAGAGWGIGGPGKVAPGRGESNVSPVRAKPVRPPSGTKTVNTSYGFPHPGTPASAPSTPAAPSGPPPGSPDPGMPDTSAGTYNIGLVPADENAKADAAQTYADSATNARAGIQSSAMAYGDPSLMAQWGLSPAVNPNSALAIAALRAQEQQQRDNDARERAGTFFSSLHQQDLGTIANTQERSQLAGFQKYQAALAKFNAAMTAAEEARAKTVRDANMDERQNAINNLPTAQTTASGGFQGGISNITQKVPTAAPPGSRGQAPRGGKVPTLKKPSGTKTPKGKPSKTKVTSNAPSRTVSKVKTGVRRISGGRGRK